MLFLYLLRCTGIPGDGRCLFRSVAHGACIRLGNSAPDENAQRELADELRARVSCSLGFNFNLNFVTLHIC